MAAKRASLTNLPAKPANGVVGGTSAAAIGPESALDDTASSAAATSPGQGGQGRGSQVLTTSLQGMGLMWEYAVVPGFARFKTSAAPSRIMFFAGGVWFNCVSPVLEILREGFTAGKAIMDVRVGGSYYLFDFVRMLRIDVATNDRNSIAWVDANGRLFLPQTASIGRSIAVPKSRLEARIHGDGGAVPSGDPIEGNVVSPEPLAEHSDESQVVPVACSLERHKWTGLQVLDAGDRFYKVVENTFLTGMRRFAPDTRITSIFRCTYAGVSASQRLKTFMKQTEMTKAARGAANVRLGWYGTSASLITSLVSYGFGLPNSRFLGPETRAQGVYLAPQNYPVASSLLSKTDDAGEKHVVLCRIIMGNSEKVDTRAAQFHPSSDEFDCGMDDLERPTWYIVWTTHMNTHVIPEYVVSFKTSYSGPLVKEAPAKRMPRKIPLSFPQLFSEIGNSLPSSKMQALEILYGRLKEGKLSKDVFQQNLRAIAGDKLLTTTIKRYCKCL